LCHKRFGLLALSYLQCNIAISGSNILPNAITHLNEQYLNEKYLNEMDDTQDVNEGKEDNVLDGQMKFYP